MKKLLLIGLVLAAMLLNACGAAQPTESSVGAVKGNASLVEFTGVIDSINGDQWVVNGQPLTVDPAIIKDGPFKVGDTIKVVLRNNASFPFSLHPHGVAYSRDSEGAMYGDGMEHPEADGLVPPGKTHTYTWLVREEAGPGPQDGSSIAWLYHSHDYEPKDVNAGLIGAIVITRRGMARADGSPKDIAHEFFSLFMIIDENQSHYFGQNVKAHVADTAKLNRGEYLPVDPEGNGDLPLGTGFGTSNMKSTINGYLFGNGPLMTMRKGEHVRWYVMTLGIGFNFHTPHWHGNVVNVRGQYMDVLPAIGPAQAVTADMVPDMVGTWMFHCHLDDHMKGGMQTLYRVLDSEPQRSSVAAPDAVAAASPQDKKPQ